jgi:hypothetical protein
MGMREPPAAKNSIRIMERIPDVRLESMVTWDCHRGYVAVHIVNHCWHAQLVACLNRYSLIISCPKGSLRCFVSAGLNTLHLEDGRGRNQMQIRKDCLGRFTGCPYTLYAVKVILLKEVLD